MAHYALLDENNVVTKVIVGVDETELIEGLDPETWYGSFTGQTCKRTSYNGNIRKQYAGIGFTYNSINDVFISPQPYSSWTLDSNFDWQAPVPYPMDNKDYDWDEQTKNWIEVEILIGKTDAQTMCSSYSASGANR